MGGETASAARLLREIREHRRTCQWSCPECKAWLARKEAEAQREGDAEREIAQIFQKADT